MQLKSVREKSYRSSYSLDSLCNVMFAFIISSPQINRSSFSFGAPGESSVSSAGVLELGMSEEGAPNFCHIVQLLVY